MKSIKWTKQVAGIYTAVIGGKEVADIIHGRHFWRVEYHDLPMCETDYFQTLREAKNHIVRNMA